jgi:hypothetical protein
VYFSEFACNSQTNYLLLGITWDVTLK